MHFKISNSVFNLEGCFGRNERFLPHLRFYQTPTQLEHPQFLSVFEGSIVFQGCRHFTAQQSPANFRRKEKAEEIPDLKHPCPRGITGTNVRRLGACKTLYLPRSLPISFPSIHHLVVAVLLTADPMNFRCSSCVLELPCCKCLEG